MIRKNLVKKFAPAQAKNSTSIAAMKPSFHPKLINDPFSDPGLYIPFLFEKRALMFDLGDLQPLSSRDLLKISHVFVTHFHMDHFIGFDTLLRVFLGREKDLHLYGPPGFFRHIEGKLAGYAWNLVEGYQNQLTLKITEIRPDKTITRAYACRDRFIHKGTSEENVFSGLLLEEPGFHVEAALLDHRIPCLGLSLVEHFHVNIIKEGLKKFGLEVGPWINGFKKAIYENKPPDEDFIVTLEEKGDIIGEKRFLFGDLIDGIARISPGQRITYITDVLGSRENMEKMIHLAGDSDHLFIEAAFMESHRADAEKKYHLTAYEAGTVAGKAGVKQFTLFHFSPRYSHMEDDINREALEAFKRRQG